MTVFAISDLHLSFADPKPMDIFGPDWEDHPDKVARVWDEIVAPADLVLIAGDTSWAMKAPDAMPDLDYLAARPGRKFLIRGNHDYWWGRQSTNKIQRAIDPSITLLHGSGVIIEGVGVTGTRGWRLEDSDSDEDGADAKIFDRELAYLRRGLESIAAAETKIAMLHYPPFGLDLQPTAFRAVLEEFGVDILVYGHVHKGSSAYLEGDIGGIKYCLAAVDHTAFRPVAVWEGNEK